MQLSSSLTPLNEPLKIPAPVLMTLSASRVSEVIVLTGVTVCVTAAQVDIIAVGLKADVWLQSTVTVLSLSINKVVVFTSLSGLAPTACEADTLAPTAFEADNLATTACEAAGGLWTMFMTLASAMVVAVMVVFTLVVEGAGSSS